jgi:hypothetical protein
MVLFQSLGLPLNGVDRPSIEDLDIVGRRVIDGTSVVVLADSNDRPEYYTEYYFDPSRDYLLVGSDSALIDGRPTGHVRFEYEENDRGRHVPKSILRVGYLPAGRLSFTETVTIESLEVDGWIDDSEFEIEIAPGTYVYDYIRDMEYTVGVDEPVDETPEPTPEAAPVETATEHAAPPPIYVEPRPVEPPTRGFWTFGRIGFSLTCLIAGGSMIALAFSMRRKG